MAGRGDSDLGAAKAFRRADRRIQHSELLYSIWRKPPVEDVNAIDTDKALDGKPVHELLSVSTSIVESLNDILFSCWLRRRDCGPTVSPSVELREELINGWIQTVSITKRAEVLRVHLIVGHQCASSEPMAQEIPMFNAIARANRTLKELCGHLAEEEEAEAHRQIEVLLDEFDRCFAKLVEVFNVCRRRIGMPELER